MESANVITQDHIARSGDSVLSPAYFSSREIVSQFMKSFSDENFAPLATEFSKLFYEKLNEDIQAWLLADTESNLHGWMYRQVDDCVKALLSGEKWALERYALSERYDGGVKIRAAVAQHIPSEIMDARIADLEAENEQLRNDLKWYRELRS